MLTPRYLDLCTIDILKIYEEMNISLVQDMARRLVKLGDLDEDYDYEADRAIEAGELHSNTMHSLNAVSKKSDNEIRLLFIAAGTMALKYDDAIYRQVGLNPMPLNQSPDLLVALDNGIETAQGILYNFTKTTAVATQTQFIEAANIAYTRVASGSTSYTQAIRQAVRSVSRAGISSIQYPSGRREKIDVAVRRAVLTGVNQLSGTLQLLRSDEFGCDLLETTAHIGARDTHEVWQGQVFSKTGRGYPDFYDETGYGTGEGLCGWNCRHNFFPYYEGFSNPAYSLDALEEMENTTVSFDGDEIPYYDATQIQRRLEREIRETKRETAGFAAALDESRDAALSQELQGSFTSASVRLKNQEQRLRDFVDQTGLVRQNEREQVEGFDKSIAQRAVWANRKA